MGAQAPLSPRMPPTSLLESQALYFVNATDLSDLERLSAFSDVVDSTISLSLSLPLSRL